MIQCLKICPQRQIRPPVGLWGSVLIKQSQQQRNPAWGVLQSWLLCLEKKENNTVRQELNIFEFFLWIKKKLPFSSKAATLVVPWWRRADLGMVNKTSPSSMSSLANIPYSDTVPSALTYTCGQRQMYWTHGEVSDRWALRPSEWWIRRMSNISFRSTKTSPYYWVPDQRHHTTEETSPVGGSLRNHPPVSHRTTAIENINTSTFHLAS